MRLVYVCCDPGIGVFGPKGASIHVQELVRAYRQLGHDVVVRAVRGGGDAPPDLVDLEVRTTGRPAGRDVGRRELATVALADGLAAGLAREARTDLVHERYSLWGGAGVLAAAALGVPSVLEVNAPLIDEQREHRGIVHETLALDRLRVAVAAATAVVAVSEPVAAWVRERSGRQDVEVVPNGVDPDRFTARRPGDDREIGVGGFTIGFVGSLKPWHGLDTLVSAVARLREDVPDARLLVVGDGPGRDALREDAAARGVPLEAVGAVHHAEVPALLARMDVACAPYPAGTNAAYFSPLKVLEYLAAGVPVVASDTGQLPQLLGDGRYGRLVRPGNPGQLAAALRELAADPAQRDALARAGRAAVLRGRRWVDVAGRTLALTTARHRRARDGGHERGLRRAVAP